MSREVLVGAMIAVAGCISISAPDADAPVRPPVVERPPAESDLLEMSVARDTLDLINRTGDPVFYFLAEAGAVPVMLADPCAEPATCPGVTRRDTRRIPLASIPLTPTATAIAVLHWRLVPAATASGFKPDSVRTRIVSLR